ncbi:MAG: restriction endonuclease subunit R, partial [Eubacteriales bacterium]
MHKEVHNLDSLRKLVRELQVENKQLQELLKKANISYDSNSVFEEAVTDNAEYDPEQGERIIGEFITERHAKRFIGMFWGRIDVYAQRAKNGNYYPRCNERWNASICQIQRGDKKNCDDCPTTSWVPLTPEIVKLHLIDKSEEGKNVIGVYPMLEDSTCRFLVFDFDNHEKGAERNDFANVDDEWHHEVDALRMICKQNGVEAL